MKVLAAFLSCLVACAGAQTKLCNQAQARHALDEAGGTLHTWDAVYRSYLKYRNCDDGAVAEGYSDNVAQILARHWNSLPRLDLLTRNDPQFRVFVLRHIDATDASEDLEKIVSHAKSECPKGLTTLCGDISKQAGAALTEIKAAVGN